MSYTDDEYKELGCPISEPQMADIQYHKDKLPLVSTIARVIYAEMNSDPVGQACVAQELHNRMRNWVFNNGRKIKYLHEEYQNWYGVLFAPEQYSPIFDPHLNETGPLKPAENWDNKTPSQKAGWINAVDLATVLVDSKTLFVGEPFADVTTTVNMHDQMRHYYYKDDSVIAQIRDSIREHGSVVGPDNKPHAYCEHYYNNKLEIKWDPIIIGKDVFYNDEDTVGNRVNEIITPHIPPNVGEAPNNTGIPLQKASDLVEFLKSRVGCGYVLGTYGQICTQELLEKRAADDPENGASYYLGNCARWIGKLVTDCSGLIEWFLLKQGVTNCDSYSGGMYKQWCTERSTDMSIMVHQPGVVVFKRNSNGIYHMGIYVGKDRVIEARGAMHGVVVSQFSADPAWNAWGYFDWLIYDIVDTDVEQLPVITDALTYGPLPGYPDIRTSTAEVVQHTGSYNSPVYKNGDSGDKIEMIRRRFWAADNSFAVSNFFDDALEAKIKAFQTANGLTSDGIVGSGTWKVLFPVLKKRTGSQAGAREMQALLNYQNYPVGTPDGLFGTGTETVLKAYQKARQLDADGICGEKTWQSLTLEEPFETEVLVDQNGDSTALCEMGDSNDVVRQLQQRLATQYPLNVTGTYDSATNQYVLAYQTANSITANGIVGPITWNKLFPILKMGRGTKDQVRALQVLLYRQKHGLLIDGVFGSGTQAAVKAYQTLRNLTSDGIVGANTWASLCLATPPAGNALYFGTGGSSSGSGTIYRQGDTGAAIHQIKRRMAVESMFTGTVNAVFDAELTYAVKVFQASEDIRVDGLVGPATWSLLFPIVKKQTGQQEGAKAVQALLNLNGYNVGTPDGLFGTGSENKLKQFQTAKGLDSDGVCGAKTWAKLCEV